MKSTMMDSSLTLDRILRHGRTAFPNSVVASFQGESTRNSTFSTVADRAELLAAALKRLGVKKDDRVGTLCWNHQEHLETYFAVPGMGAVLHTVNFRLFPEQIAYIINHAEDRVIVVDPSIAPIVAKIRSDLKTVKHVIVTGDAETELEDALRYEHVVGAEEPGFSWPSLDERSAAAMCYTSGTTGNPKGVVYSHRAIYLHSLGEWGAMGLNDRDRFLLIVPMFHVNAWGLPYTAFMIGADMVMPGPFLQAEPLTRLIAAERPTFAGAVPTVWADVLRYSEANPVDLSSLRLVICGGSAVPRVLMERFQNELGVRIIQAWGMTETGPLAALALPPRGAEGEKEWTYRARTGRTIFDVELRIADDAGNPLPWDGVASGEIQVRGPWVTGSYYKDPAPEKFTADGWLCTGDVGTVDPEGYVQITDRSKDVIKSGGEWISSVQLEGLLSAHPDVAEAAVIAVPDERWQERPLACVVPREGVTPDFGKLREFLSDKVAKWWLPERWAIVAEVPKTGIGKFDKKVLRGMHAEGRLAVTTLGEAQR